MQSRTERLMANAPDDVDAIVIANDSEPMLDPTFFYLVQPTGGVFEGCFAIVHRDGTMDVVANILEEESARTGKGDARIYRSRAELESIVRDSLKGCRKVGFNTDSVSYATVNAIRKLADYSFVETDVRKAVADTVAIKDAQEIEATRKACAITSQVAREIPDLLEEGVTETEVAAKMDMRQKELGGTKNSFDTIAAFGANSSMPHYMPGNKRLENGDAALFDFGTVYDRYCSDLTRTVFFGEPDDILKRAYEVVREAQQAGIDAYCDGAMARDADLAAREIIDASEFKGRFIHSFGHGIGQVVHQAIYVSPRSEQVLHAGNIVSAEPGIYLPGIGGIRIEDTVLITENGCERLTDYPHELTIVDPKR